ncbi:MAG: carbon-nitrogen hydrolase family protein [Chloroflexi bacterium]|nr:carbon-nitrogen hydrolase family protein [Chloroflexota bacterium]
MKMKVAAVQLAASDDVARNLAAAESLIDEAVSKGAQIVALPETWSCISEDNDLIRANAEPMDGPIVQRLQAKARAPQIYLHCGSLNERIPGSDKTYNTTVLLGPTGDPLATYRKIHLYDVDLGPNQRYQESAVVAAGSETVVTEIGPLTAGLAICYDLRFPELFRDLALKGAEAVFMPAAFNAFTGKDHWEILIRARAVENQNYMICPDIVGAWGAQGKLCYGRSMIVDPWGTVIAQAPDEPAAIVAEIDTERVAKIRKELPSLANRRLI